MKHQKSAATDGINVNMKIALGVVFFFLCGATKGTEVTKLNEHTKRALVILYISNPVSVYQKVSCSPFNQKCGQFADQKRVTVFLFESVFYSN